MSEYLQTKTLNSKVSVTYETVVTDTTPYRDTEVCEKQEDNGEALDNE